MTHRIALFLVCVGVGMTGPAQAQLEQQPTEFEDSSPKKAPQLTRPPELIESVDPIYPEAAQREGRSGQVTLQITIDAAGGVTRLDVVTSAGADLDFAAMGAAANFWFLPAEIDDKPAPVAIQYTTVFELQEVAVEVPEAPPDLPEVIEGEDVEAPVNFIGLVREAASKIPLAGVEVSLDFVSTPTDAEEPPGSSQRMTYTDEEGRFAFRGLPTGPFQVSFGYPGYQPAFIDEEVVEGKRTETIVYLTPRDTNRFETIIRERRAKKEVAKIALSREEVRRVPGTFGDPVRVIQNLPGLARAPFAGGALIVRGANPADSGFYFDGVSIPILYHFGGLTSVVNPEFLEDINFYPGGFGPFYGRATAGIVDVDSRKLNLRTFRGYAEVDVLDSGFFFGGPVKLGNLPTFTFAAAARRSYIDALIPLVLDTIVGPDGQGVVAAPVYWDYQVKLETAPLPGQRFSLFAFGSDDDLRVISRGTGVDDGFSLGFKQSFHRLVGRWESRLPGGIRHFTQPYLGLNWTNIKTDSDIGLSGKIGQYAWNWGLRDELRIKPVEQLELAFGLDYFGNTFGVDIEFPIPIEIGSFPRVISRVPETNQRFGSAGLGNAAALYAEALIRPIPSLLLVPGIRAESTTILIDDQNVQGLDVEGSDVLLWNVDPRVTVRYEPFEGTALKGAFGVYRQLPAAQQLSQEAGNPWLQQPRALQYIVGAEHNLTDSLQLDVQLYHTARDLLVQSTSETINRGDGQVDPVFFTNGGRGRTTGIEVLLRQNITKNFYGWVAYTLSRTEIDTSEARDRYRLANFDQTHILTVVAQTNLPWGFTLGGRFRLVSGNPTTVPVGSLHDLDTNDYNALSSRTPARLPAFHQLDVRLDRKWVFDTFSMTTYIDLLNAYNAQNAEGYQSDYRNREQQAIPGLPIVPVFGVSGEF